MTLDNSLSLSRFHVQLFPLSLPLSFIFISICSFSFSHIYISTFTSCSLVLHYLFHVHCFCFHFHFLVSTNLHQFKLSQYQTLKFCIFLQNLSLTTLFRPLFTEDHVKVIMRVFEIEYSMSWKVPLQCMHISWALSNLFRIFAEITSRLELMQDSWTVWQGLQSEVTSEIRKATSNHMYLFRRWMVALLTTMTLIQLQPRTKFLWWEWSW